MALVFSMGFYKRCNTGKFPVLIYGDSKGDTLDVAMIYGPLSYYVYDDTLGGLNYELLNNFKSKSTRPLKFWPVINLEDAYHGLEVGAYDILASLPSDYNLSKRFLTIDNVFLDRLVLIQSIDSQRRNFINSALDLADKTIYVQKYSPALTRIRNLSSEIGSNIEIIEETGVSEEYLCIMVATGEISLAIVNEKVAAEMATIYKNLSFDNPVSFTQFQIWLLNPSDSLLKNEIDLWLKQYRETEEYKNLQKKYSVK